MGNGHRGSIILRCHQTWLPGKSPHKNAQNGYSTCKIIELYGGFFGYCPMFVTRRQPCSPLAVDHWDWNHQATKKSKVLWGMIYINRNPGWYPWLWHAGGWYSYGDIMGYPHGNDDQIHGISSDGSQVMLVTLLTIQWNPLKNEANPSERWTYSSSPHWRWPTCFLHGSHDIQAIPGIKRLTLFRTDDSWDRAGSLIII